MNPTRRIATIAPITIQIGMLVLSYSPGHWGYSPEPSNDKRHDQ